MSGNAYVTLVTSDSYVVGAVVLACSLRKLGVEDDVTVLATSSTLSAEACTILQKNFDKFIDVDVLRSTDHQNLRLLGREELDVTFTKIHVFNPDVMPYEKVVFLDADTLAVKPVDVLFQYVSHPDIVFAAAPDIGWPDCFNSGVFVTRPSKELFDSLLSFASSLGSFDGGDQGLLNAFFYNWSGHEYSAKASLRPSPFTKKCARLPFIYNVTPSTMYSYLPAFKFYNDHIHIAHFIGRQKPWSYDRTTSGRTMPKGDTSEVTLNLMDYWWRVFDEFKVQSAISSLAVRHPGGWNFNSVSGTSDGFQFGLGFKSQSPGSTHGPSQGQEVADFANYRVEWNEQELGKHSMKSSSGKVRLQSPATNASGDDEVAHPSPKLKTGKSGESGFAGFKFTSGRSEAKETSSTSSSTPSTASKLTSVFRTSSKTKTPKESTTTGTPEASVVGGAAAPSTQETSTGSVSSGGFLSGHLFGSKSGSIKVKEKDNRKSVLGSAAAEASRNSSSSSLSTSENDGTPGSEKKKKLVNKLKFWK